MPCLGSWLTASELCRAARSSKALQSSLSTFLNSKATSGRMSPHSIWRKCQSCRPAVDLRMSARASKHDPCRERTTRLTARARAHFTIGSSRVRMLAIVPSSAETGQTLFPRHSIESPSLLTLPSSIKHFGRCTLTARCIGGRGICHYRNGQVSSTKRTIPGEHQTAALRDRFTSNLRIFVIQEIAGCRNALCARSAQ